MALTTIDDRGLKTPIDLLDNEKIRLGTGNDLEFYHDGSHSILKDAGTGNLRILTNNLRIENAAGTENQALFTEDGSVELYHDNVKKLETTSNGAHVTGTLGADGLSLGDSEYLKIGASEDLQLYHDGHSVIKDSGAAALLIASDETRLLNNGLTENLAKFIANGAVELYYDNSKKFETTSDGGQVTGALKVKVAGTSYGDGLILEDNDSTTKSELTHVDGTLYISSDASTNHLTIDSDGHVNIPNDNDQLRLGAGQDLLLYSDGTQGIIRSANGRGYIQSDTGISISSIGYTEKYIEATKDGSVELYYDNSKKFETKSYGANMPDNSQLYFGTGDDLVIKHDGTDSRIINAGSDLYLYTTGDHEVKILADSQNAVICKPDAAVELYYDNSKKFETTSNGAKIHGDLYLDNATNAGKDIHWDESGNTVAFSDDVDAKFGDGGDLRILHDGTDNVITSDTSASIRLVNHLTGGNETMGKFIPNGAVELYHNGNKKLYTHASGISVDGDVRPAADSTYSIGSSDYKWTAIYADNTNIQDLNMSNLDAESPNEVDGTRGSWTVQEGADDLFLINRRNGKKYKFNLTEII